MGKFTYKNVKVNVYKEDNGVYNFDAEKNGHMLGDMDNLFRARNMEMAEKMVKKFIDTEIRRVD